MFVRNTKSGIKFVTRGLRKSVMESAGSRGVGDAGLRASICRNFVNNYANFSPSSGVYDPQSPKTQPNYGLAAESAKIEEER